jgi:hypothetical protein
MKNENSYTESSSPNDLFDLPHFREHSILEGAVSEATRELSVSHGMAMMSALGAVAVACQGLVDVKMPTGKIVPTSLMLLTIADSGERKTTTQSYFFKSIRELNLDSHEKHKEALIKHKVHHDLWISVKRQLERAHGRQFASGDAQATNTAFAALKTHLEQEPKRPPSEKFLYEDTTPQALLQLLNENNKNGCLLTSEANSIFSGKALDELDKLNTLWDGGEVIVDRISRPSFILSDARLTLALMTQPSVIKKFMTKRGAEARGTGFLSRFIAFKPQTMAGSRPDTKETPLTRKLEFNKRVKEILLSEKEKTRQTLHLSETAANIWYKYNQKLESEMKENGIYFYSKDHASKLLENATRLAANLHTFERNSNQDTEISSDTLIFSWNVIRYCSNHFLSELAGEPQVITDANLLAHFLTRRCKTKPSPIKYDPSSTQPIHINITLSEIKRSGPNPLRQSSESARLDAAIDLIRKLGHIEKTGTQYRFQDTILDKYVPKGPELRNGEFVTVKELPLFNEQELAPTGIYGSHRYIKRKI